MPDTTTSIVGNLTDDSEVRSTEGGMPGPCSEGGMVRHNGEPQPLLDPRGVPARLRAIQRCLSRSVEHARSVR